MDYSNLKLPKPNFTGLLLAIAAGVIVAVGLYQAQVRGLIPAANLNVPKLPGQETRTVLKEENVIIDVAKKASPSVIAIGISKRVVNPFDPFAIPRKEDSTIGTGFVMSEKGIIVTNKHVVSDTGVTYSVVTKDGQKYDVQRIYRDPILDLALVQVNAAGLKPLELGDSSKLQVGQTAIAIGNALGRFTNTVTTGVVSGLGRRVTAGDPFSGSAESLDNLIQTDAAINPGNSGGPLLNSTGQVIGLNVATTEGAQNIGFAIPSNTIKPIIDEFVSKGSVSRPFLGIQYRFISKDVAILNEVPQGAYVQDLVDGGPAQKAGVQTGDIITKINGQTVDLENKISEIVSKSNIGQKLSLDIWRDSKTISLQVTLGDLPSE